MSIRTQITITLIKSFGGSDEETNKSIKTLVKQNIIGVENNLREVAKSLVVVVKEKKVLKKQNKNYNKKTDLLQLIIE